MWKMTRDSLIFVSFHNEEAMWLQGYFDEDGIPIALKENSYHPSSYGWFGNYISSDF